LKRRRHRLMLFSAFPLVGWHITRWCWCKVQSIIVNISFHFEHTERRLLHKRVMCINLDIYVFVCVNKFKWIVKCLFIIGCFKMNARVSEFTQRIVSCSCVVLSSLKDKYHARVSCWVHSKNSIMLVCRAEFTQRIVSL
jgi:hypothetical protein